MTWKKHYTAHLCSAEHAIKDIKSGDYVVYSQAAASPITINKALVENKDNYKDVSIYHMLFLGNPVHLSPEMEGHFRLRSSFIDGSARQAISENRADFLPAYFHQLPRFFNEKIYPADVAVMQVSRPNNKGNCSFSVTCDYIKSAAKNAKIVIAEVNDQTPWIGNKENLIHVSEMDHIVEVSHPLPEVKREIAGEIEKKIASYCASLIDDGATIQVGIGVIPDTVISFLKDRKDLGVHTELFTAGIADLVTAGVITGKRKTFHKEKIVYTFMLGDRSTYEFAHNNPMLECYPVDYTNDLNNISKNIQMVSINSCIEIDITGQIVSESIGTRLYSGTGGQVDYVKGSQLSKGGKSIIATNSTAANGTVSRIVPFLKEGAAVTTSRNDADYIITEYGIAHLRGKTLHERARLLINIAHPKFRENLEMEYHKRFGKLLFSL